MADMRDKQPDKQILDLSRMGSGDVFYAIVETWPYHSLKNETVFTRELTVKFRAADLNAAHVFAQSAARIIKLGHDVWESNVRLVAEDRFYPTPIGSAGL